MRLLDRLLGRRAPPEEAAPPPDADTWTIAEWREGGQVHLARMRALLPPADERARLPRLVVVAWRFDGGTTGMPPAAEHARMQAFEDAIEAGTECRTATRHAVVLTGGNTKEWRFYTADYEQFIASLNEDLRGHPRYPLEIRLFEDPEWNALQEIQRMGHRWK